MWFEFCVACFKISCSQAVNGNWPSFKDCNILKFELCLQLFIMLKIIGFVLTLCVFQITGKLVICRGLNTLTTDNFQCKVNCLWTIRHRITSTELLWTVIFTWNGNRWDNYRLKFLDCVNRFHSDFPYTGIPSIRGGARVKPGEFSAFVSRLNPLDSWFLEGRNRYEKYDCQNELRWLSPWDKNRKFAYKLWSFQNYFDPRLRLFLVSQDESDGNLSDYCDCNARLTELQITQGTAVRIVVIIFRM